MISSCKCSKASTTRTRFKTHFEDPPLTTLPCADPLQAAPPPCRRGVTRRREPPAVEIQRRHFDLVSPRDLACSPPLIASVGCGGGDEAPRRNHGDLRPVSTRRAHPAAARAPERDAAPVLSSSHRSVKDSKILFTAVFKLRRV